MTRVAFLAAFAMLAGCYRAIKTGPGIARAEHENSSCAAQFEAVRLDDAEALEHAFEACLDADSSNDACRTSLRAVNEKAAAFSE